MMSAALGDLPGGTVLELPIAHNVGNWRAEPDEIERLRARGQIALRYCGPDGDLSEQHNPNGSAGSVAGVLDETGRALGLMPHPERASWPEVSRGDGLVLLRAFALQSPILHRGG